MTKKAITKFAITYLTFLLIFAMQKPVFMAVYASRMGAGIGFTDWIDVIVHGMAMDRCVAGYLSIIPGLLIIAQLWEKRHWPIIAERIYFGLVATVLGIIFCLDIILYGYWGFRLDMTPIFYFTSSPGAAIASAEWWQIPIAILTAILASAAIWIAFQYCSMRLRIEQLRCRPWGATVAMAILTIALFIPIRGSLTVSTMNISRSYFSQNQSLNHAAVNPAFSLLYSATHQGNFGEQYRFMQPDEAERLFTELLSPATTDTIAYSNSLLSTTRPDIYIIILESFSSHLMPSLGGEAVATGLDSIANSGILFTNFYASSFRTDRALPAILSGFPAQPSTSLLKYVDKIERIPSLPNSLKNAGYTLSYYYGGDANFTNLRAYLVSMGFENIISDHDFPLQERTGKWGAHDHNVFNRAIADITKKRVPQSPQLTVIQTSSSHEPFEVPYTDQRFADNPRLNAFAYTDKCLSSFVNTLHNSPLWDNALITIVPDHYGAWPQGLESPLARHTIPLVFTGGALKNPGTKIDAVSSQTDIAATILSALELPHEEFTFSRDILDHATPQVAVFTEPSLIGLITPSDTIVYNCDANIPVIATGINAELRQRQARAYLQTLYTTIDNL